MPARTSRGTAASATVPQAWHSPHRPTHLGACQPHSLHRNAAVDFAMPAHYRRGPTFDVPRVSWAGEHARREENAMTALPPIPVVLSSSSVYPEKTPDAFDAAAKLGYDGGEGM